MQEKASVAAAKLLTAQQLQTMLEVDRSTVYRMAEDGRLPAIKVGRQWRFPADRIAALLDPASTAEPQPLSTARHRRATASAGQPPVESALGAEALSVLQISAEVLGVMMVVTDMNGRPVTPVVNRCPWFDERVDDPETVSACRAEWQSMADDPDCVPRFHTGVLGFDCARAFIRSGSELVGMVLAGGIAPSSSGTTGLYRLSDEERRWVIRSLPRVAAALSHVTPRGAGSSDRRSAS
jgi:excisionase family DNA binding protein